MSDDPSPAAPLRYRPGPVGAVVTAAVFGVGALWFTLSVMTGLIFHFMPGAPIVAAVWVQRAYGPDRALAWPSLWAHVTGGLLVTVMTGAALAVVGAPLDAGWEVAAVVVVGTGIAVWLGRRRAA